MRAHDRRLIEDYLPIKAISAEASREKSVRKGHISTLHLWWARRPLVACRAAVYGALVPASRFVPENGPDEKKRSLGRANAAKFVTDLCRYPGAPNVIEEAKRHILEAHAERLTEETGKPVTVEDIVEGRAPRPKVLDMFAGGGAIPLEALRLGCEAYALDLNPVAHIIELCTLVYPQKYGRPDPTARGMTGPKNEKGETTWGGLADEVRYWGEWVLKKVKAEIGDLYPLIPDPAYKGQGRGKKKAQATLFDVESKDDVPPGFLMPVAYLWTRTVRCKNPKCGATVPLVKQTWLCRKKGRFVALKVVAPRGKKQVRFEVVESETEKGLGFDPAAGSKGGNATCPFCGTVVDARYVQDEGKAKRVGTQLMAVVCTKPGTRGKVYVSATDLAGTVLPDEDAIRARIDALCRKTGLTVPNEPINPLRPSPNARGLSAVTRHGLSTFAELTSARQTLCLLTFAAAIREVEAGIGVLGLNAEWARSVVAYLAILVDRQADYNSMLCHWHNTGEKIGNTFGRQALSMVWDFVELAPFGDASGSPKGAIDWIVGVVQTQAGNGEPAVLARGSATSPPWPEKSFDAIVTDPPYYDNVPYSDVSDFFYVWLKRTIGHLYPEHFASDLTPKKAEATALANRHAGDMAKATAEYESMMLDSLKEASRVLKPDGQLVIVYAHKTTLGWSTLVDALRRAGFTVTEAWPLDTEMGSRLVAAEAAALASSIFLVARKRDAAEAGSYETDVRPELDRIVRERVDTLWAMGITGADLVIAAVGAGLRAFTRFARVEYANGEEVPAERFLAEVEGVVLETLMAKIFGLAGTNVSAIDGPSRFYILWRYTYRTAPLDAGEAIVFTYGQNVELDGAQGLSTGKNALVEKKKGSYRLRDFSERGGAEKLGMPENLPAPQSGASRQAGGSPAPLIDTLHRVLWLVENRPKALGKYLDEARPDAEHLRLVAQTLAGAGLSGKTEEEAERLVATTPAEQAALKKLLQNWRSLIEQRLTAEEGTLFDTRRK